MIIVGSVSVCMHVCWEMGRVRMPFYVHFHVRK